MRLLLDTHAFLWFIQDNPRLSTRAKDLLESDANLFISPASLWEIAIKVSTRKLTLARPFETFVPDQLARNAIEILPIGIEPLALLSALPFHHRDPFDRLLVAQAIAGRLSIVSMDDQLDLCHVERVW